MGQNRREGEAKSRKLQAYRFMMLINRKYNTHMTIAKEPMAMNPSLRMMMQVWMSEEGGKKFATKPINTMLKATVQLCDNACRNSSICPDVDLESTDGGRRPNNLQMMVQTRPKTQRHQAKPIRPAQTSKKMEKAWGS